MQRVCTFFKYPPNDIVGTHTFVTIKPRELLIYAIGVYGKFEEIIVIKVNVNVVQTFF